MSSPRRSSLLERVGRRIRAARTQAKLTRRALAQRSGLSERFLAQLEAGRGNVSIGRLEEVAIALGWTIDELVRAEDLDAEGRALVRAVAGARPEHRTALSRRLEDLEGAAPVPAAGALVALVGLRGAGKSTLGARVARGLGVRFVELKSRVEHLSGLSVTEIFALYGDEGFRRLERRCLEEVARTSEPTVLAVPGGVLDAPDTYQFLLDHFWTVWLRARPEDHMARVRAQGDQRPMQGHPNAMDDLRAILHRREALHRRAHAQLDTSERSEDTAADELQSLVAAYLARRAATG